MNKLSNTKVYSKFWKRYYKVYDILNEVRPYQKLIKQIVQELNVTPGMKVLDAGAGSGNITIQIRKLGGAPIALDAVQEALEIYKWKDPKAEVISHDLLEPWPFKDNYFDAIVLNNVLYSIDISNHKKIIAEANRVLKPKGKIIISNPLENATPKKILLEHLNITMEQEGLLQLIKHVNRYFVASTQLLLFNYFIKRTAGRGYFHFFKNGEQATLLQKSNFLVKKSYNVYSDQNELVVGEK